jgi:hypothetical protein
VVALVVHGHFVVVINRIGRGKARGFESFKKWIQKQDHSHYSNYWRPMAAAQYGIYHLVAIAQLPASDPD